MISIKLDLHLRTTYSGDYQFPGLHERDSRHRRLCRQEFFQE